MLQMMTRTAIHPLKIAAGVGAAFVLWGLVLAYASSPAYADTTFAVNSTGDENDLDFPGGTFDGSSDAKCDVDSGAAGDQCTLRAAIQEANVTAGADTINFGLGQSATITLASQLPTITDPAELTIDGGSTDITVSGGGNVRVFQVASGAKLALDNLTVANGLAAGDENPSDTFGGGAANFGGTLTISNSTFSGNDASGTSFGGGVATTDGGTLNVTDSTFSGNSAVFGGGIYSTNSSTTVTLLL
jgi:CSLREA domain-containing protein